MLEPCKRCGAQSAAYLDLDFTCSRRRCGIKSILEAKRDCLAIAMEGPESAAAKRKAAQIAFTTMAEMKFAGSSYRDWQDLIKWMATGVDPRAQQTDEEYARDEEDAERVRASKEGFPDDE